MIRPQRTNQFVFSMKWDENAVWTRSKNASTNGSVTRSLARFWSAIWPVWPRDERDQLKREKEIHAFAGANGWLATIRDPGIQVMFRRVGI
jgi:hypothetical protein